MLLLASTVTLIKLYCLCRHKKNIKLMSYQHAVKFTKLLFSFFTRLEQIRVRMSRYHVTSSILYINFFVKIACFSVVYSHVELIVTCMHYTFYYITSTYVYM